jgi:UDP-4-amino-4,6-dideoxy-N-acetyl-beta-L-altrosamine N-acetyltransferase
LNEKDKCVVRELTAGDLESVLIWRNQPEVRSVMFSQHLITSDEHRRWFEKASVDPARRLLIVDSAHGALGFVHFSAVALGGIADWGFFKAVGAPAGAGIRLAQAALDHGFQRLGLHKVCGQVLGFNEKSLRLHSRLGFRQEGTLRDQHRIGQIYHDVIFFGQLRDEWRGVRE